MPERPLEYAIIGGGISGLTLAIALHHRGVAVKLYEQAHQFGEIGAGVSFSPNALQAMKICHSGIYDAFEKVCTKNLWPSKQKVWFDYYDGQNEKKEDAFKGPAFSIRNDLGQNGVHRARFLEELLKLVPSTITSLGKKLVKLDQTSENRCILSFSDDSTEEVDAVLACDGIKSTVRKLLFGSDHPCALPSFTHKYAYRALVPMEAAVAAIGGEKAQNACMHLGKGGHVLTFPVNHGKTVNVVAFRTTAEDWPDQSKLTASATREDALLDFKGFGHSIIRLLELAEPKLDIWAIFDLGDSPPPTFAKGSICLVGDAAHGTSPHHGAGAGFCLEDSAVLAELLSDDKLKERDDIGVALSAFDATRRERTSWLVQSSRHIGDTYECMVPGIDDDLKKIEEDINHRNALIADVNVKEMCEDARAEFARLRQLRAST